MLGHKYSNVINPNIRPIDDVLKDKTISKEARDMIIQNEVKRKILKLEISNPNVVNEQRDKTANL